MSSRPDSEIEIRLHDAVRRYVDEQVAIFTASTFPRDWRFLWLRRRERRHDLGIHRLRRWP